MRNANPNTFNPDKANTVHTTTEFDNTAETYVLENVESATPRTGPTPQAGPARGQGLKVMMIMLEGRLSILVQEMTFKNKESKAHSDSDNSME